MKNLILSIFAVAALLVSIFNAIRPREASANTGCVSIGNHAAYIVRCVDEYAVCYVSYESVSCVKR